MYLPLNWLKDFVDILESIIQEEHGLRLKVVLNNFIIDNYKII